MVHYLQFKREARTWFTVHDLKVGLANGSRFTISSNGGIVYTGASVYNVEQRVQGGTK